MNSKKVIVTLFFMPIFLVGCGEEDVYQVRAITVPSIDCETKSVHDELLKNLAAKLIEEGAKGLPTSDLQKLLVLKNVMPMEKSANRDYIKCSAKLAIQYPENFAASVSEFFLNESSYMTFKDELEDKYGIIAGAGMHAQLMDAIADGPFGAVPFAPYPATISRYHPTIRKNLGALIQEQLDVAVAYELSIGIDPNGKPTEQLKWQINKRDAMDINVVLLSISNLL